MPQLTTIGRYTIMDCSACGELFQVETSADAGEDLDKLNRLSQEHIDANPKCEEYFLNLPSLDDIRESFQKCWESRQHLTMDELAPVLPLRRRMTPFVEDANGRLVFICDWCEKLYTDRIEEEPTYSCECGRFLQRIEEATAEDCGIKESP